jgi:hypothetical protein
MAAALFGLGCFACGAPAPDVYYPSSGGTPPQQQEESSPFQAEYVESIENPEVVIVNQTQLDITIQVSGPASPTIVVPAGTAQSVSVPPGTYSYSASAPGVEGTTGSHQFDAHERYTWQFVLQ